MAKIPDPKKILEFFRAERQKPQTARAVAEHFRLPRDAREGLEEVLVDMAVSRVLKTVKGGAFALGREGRERDAREASHRPAKNLAARQKAGKREDRKKERGRDRDKHALRSSAEDAAAIGAEGPVLRCRLVQEGGQVFARPLLGQKRESLLRQAAAAQAEGPGSGGPGRKAPETKAAETLRKKREREAAAIAEIAEAPGVGEADAAAAGLAPEWPARREGAAARPAARASRSAEAPAPPASPETEAVETSLSELLARLPTDLSTLRLPLGSKELGKARPGDTALIVLDAPEAAEPGTGAPELRGRVLRHFRPALPFEEVSQRFFREYRLPRHYPKKAASEALAFADPRIEDFPGRLDLRPVKIVTIDPKTARDHDDAISLERLSSGNWSLGVHIADVAEYVEAGSEIDLEARSRAFTQYLPWTAAPMLPARLSSDLCSLLMGRDRLALSCLMEVDGAGEVVKAQFVETLIRVERFYAYEEAQAEKDAGDPFLALLAEFTRILNNRRKAEGFIDFSFAEPKVELSETGEPLSIAPSPRLESYSWIEECMLLANQVTARFLVKKKIPGLFRVHEQPDLETVAELARLEAVEGAAPDLVRALRGLKRTKNYLNPAIQAFFIQILGREATKLPPATQRKILQSMKKAAYSASCLGHFALGWLHYAHFTSPIRRYADLWTHRVIKMYLDSGKAPSRLKAEAGQVAEEVSLREIDIMKTERKAMRTATAWVLQSYVGEEFEAEVSGVEAFGLFVAVKEPMAEGLIPIAGLRDDYYVYHEDMKMLVGSRTGRRFQLGDRLRVRLLRSDPVSAQVDFGLVDKAG